MAVAIVTVTIPDQNSTWFDGKMFHATGTMTIQANPATYVTGGLTVNFGTASELIKAQRPPKWVIVTSQTGNLYDIIPGTSLATALLKIFTAINTELGNGAAIPAANSGDTLNFEAVWLGML